MDNFYGVSLRIATESLFPVLSLQVLVINSRDKVNEFLGRHYCVLNTEKMIAQEMYRVPPDVPACSLSDQLRWFLKWINQTREREEAGIRVPCNETGAVPAGASVVRWR